mmetsp:Transcript_5364/g.14501  ORF Transcript_5364/g.14501 Transcript_5364/m.14501 type:complete len:221 (+) Transcript_5364:200-862(+)
MEVVALFGYDMGGVVLASVLGRLEDDLSLDMDIGSGDVSTRDWHVHVRGPVSVVPLNIQTVIRLQGGRQLALILQGALPLNRKIAVARQCWRHTIAIVDLLGHGDLLVVSGCCELDASVVDLVIDLDLLALGRSGELDAGALQLVGHDDLLAVSRCCELDIGGIVVVSEHDVGLFIGHVVSWVDGDTSSIQVEALGGFDGLDGVSAASSGCCEAEGEIDL